MVLKFEELCKLVVDVKPSLAGRALQKSDSLVFDLCLDSLDLLQLCRKVERATASGFRSEEWAEAERAKQDQGFRIESILRAVDGAS
jgi:hypothetical protein